MFPRRLIAILHFGASVVSLFVYWVRHRDRKANWRWVLVGALFQAGYLAAYDRDVGAMRTQKRRLFGPAMVIGLGVTLLKFLFGESAQDDFTLGVDLGTAVYRFKYGVLGPLPE